jgi:2-dehydro-3-deoxygalactonokinase
MIVVDWGTSHLRAYRLNASGDIESRRAAPLGIMSVGHRAFAAVLDDFLGDWADAADGPIIMSGMIGSRQGWIEVPYVPCPAGLGELAAGVSVAPSTGKNTLFICPGLSCRDADGIPDVMRGEEVQIFGALIARRDLHSASVCLPGTHSKHALVRNDRIQGFVTHMTGEVFALMREHSILGRLMTAPQTDLDAFDEGLRRARQRSGLLHHVFSVRTRNLMGDMAAASLSDYLSGILIGHELAHSPLRPPVLVVGEPGLCALYQRALAKDGIEAELVAADLATTRGLNAVARLVGGSRT